MYKKVRTFLKEHKLQLIPYALGVGIVAGGYLLGTSYGPSWVSYLVGLPAMIGIAITALARVNDIKPNKNTWLWQLRRMGLTLAFATAVAFMYAPFSSTPLFPTWLGTLMFWGVFFTWLTTPNMPPWHKYITGER